MEDEMGDDLLKQVFAIDAEVGKRYRLDGVVLGKLIIKAKTRRRPGYVLLTFDQIDENTDENILINVSPSKILLEERVSRRGGLKQTRSRRYHTKRLKRRSRRSRR